MMLIAANLTLTAAMFGVIWIVQLVHYPLMAGIETSAFEKWHAFHSNRITFVVAPLMVGELILSPVLAWERRDLFSYSIFALTLAIWLATFALSVPIHNRLSGVTASNEFSREELLAKLVSKNWVRTLLYTAKLALLIAMIVDGARSFA